MDFKAKLKRREDQVARLVNRQAEVVENAVAVVTVGQGYVRKSRVQMQKNAV